ncbi:THAP domain-containing protein 2-like [Hydra vulgaris]|uniref:THAP domain-containing protein 2-like n=1 Tax=Hydra vulgaris TaxID=6087 RepID=A0ABM4B1F3_HYDVU
MPKKCCVMSCNGNYNKVNKEKMFWLPTDKKERARWITLIQRDNIPDSDNTVVCERHFTPSYIKIIRHDKMRPRDPPSLFTCVKKCLFSTKPGPSRINKTLSKVRSIIPDELHLINQ